MTDNLIRVSAASRATAVAGAIAGIVREHSSVQVQAIGAGAVNQAVKAVAIARSYLIGDNLDLAIVPSFTTIEVAGEDRTAMRFYIESRATEDAPKVPRQHHQLDNVI